MVKLRPFRSEDWPVLSKLQYPGMSQQQACQLIGEFNNPAYEGRRMVMLAVEQEGRIVGYVSLLEQEDGCASEGVEIYPPFRRHGYAGAALTQLMEHAKALGYRTVTAQIRRDNTASLALHRKLGFRITGEFVNKRGKPVFSLEKNIL